MADLALPSVPTPISSPSPLSPNGTSTNGLPTIDPTLVVEHLAAVLEITLGATRKDLENVGSLLSKSRYSDTMLRCTRFSGESQVVLYVTKELAISDGTNGTNGALDESGTSCFLR